MYSKNCITKVKKRKGCNKFYTMYKCYTNNLVLVVFQRNAQNTNDLIACTKDQFIVL